MHLNKDGINNKIMDLGNRAKDLDVDVILVQESHLKGRRKDPINTWLRSMESRKKVENERRNHLFRQELTHLKEDKRSIEDVY